MSLDLTIRNASYGKGADEAVDIGVAAGRIVAVETNLPPGLEDFDAGGRLVVPGFVETHVHLDKACILDRCQAEGSLAEAIAEVSRLKGRFTEEDVAARASKALRKCIVHGTTVMRTHVEVDPVIGLRGFDGVKMAARDHAWAIDVEICVFPQEGMLNNGGTEELMIAALEQGARVVGAAPYTDSDPHGQIDRVFALARRFDVDIDMHLDFDADPTNLDVEHVCRRADEHRWGGRVTVGHVTKLSFLRPNRLAEIGALLARSGVAVTVLPATDLFLGAPKHDHAIPRGVAPAHTLLQHGVTCSLSTNNILNPFTPFGDGSLVRMANLYANVGRIGGREGMAACLDMVTGNAARLINRSDYGIAVGKPADVVVLDCQDRSDAVAELAPPMIGFKAGRRTFTRPLPVLHAPTRGV